MDSIQCNNAPIKRWFAYNLGSFSINEVALWINRVDLAS